MHTMPNTTVQSKCKFRHNTIHRLIPQHFQFKYKAQTKMYIEYPNNATQEYEE